MQIILFYSILFYSPCVVLPTPMNQDSPLWDEDGLYPLGFTQA